VVVIDLGKEAGVNADPDRMGRTLCARLPGEYWTGEDAMVIDQARRVEEV